MRKILVGLIALLTFGLATAPAGATDVDHVFTRSLDQCSISAVFRVSQTTGYPRAGAKLNNQVSDPDLCVIENVALYYVDDTSEQVEWVSASGPWFDAGNWHYKIHPDANDEPYGVAVTYESHRDESGGYFTATVVATLDDSSPGNNGIITDFDFIFYE